MKSGAIAIGIIGAGIMGERLLTAILQQDPGLVQACGIWDPAADAMQRMARTFPGVSRMADATAVIAASDCVYIASPPASHLGHARAALAAGKSVFSEKPLATHVADARAFVAEAGGRGEVGALHDPGGDEDVRISIVDLLQTAGPFQVAVDDDDLFLALGVAHRAQHRHDRVTEDVAVGI